MEQTQTNQIDVQKLCLDAQKRLNMSGVTAVDSFSENTLKLTVNGNRVIIGGDNIKITSFSKTTGALSADGHFTSIKFDGAKSPMVKRLFK